MAREPLTVGGSIIEQLNSSLTSLASVVSEKQKPTYFLIRSYPIQLIWKPIVLLQ